MNVHISAEFMGKYIYRCTSHCWRWCVCVCRCLVDEFKAHSKRKVHLNGKSSSRDCTQHKYEIQKEPPKSLVSIFGLAQNCLMFTFRDVYLLCCWRYSLYYKLAAFRLYWGKTRHTHTKYIHKFTNHEKKTFICQLAYQCFWLCAEYETRFSLRSSSFIRSYTWTDDFFLCSFSVFSRGS